MLFSFMENVHRIAEPDYLPLTGALMKPNHSLTGSNKLYRGYTECPTPNLGCEGTFLRHKLEWNTRQLATVRCGGSCEYHFLVPHVVKLPLHTLFTLVHPCSLIDS